MLHLKYKEFLPKAFLQWSGPDPGIHQIQGNDPSVPSSALRRSDLLSPSRSTVSTAETTYENCRVNAVRKRG